MRVIDQIAQLVINDPYVTAKSIARQLGYAEEKTVYYWIGKTHFKGLTAFKRAVINGQFQPNQPLKARETRARYGRAAIIESATADGQPILSGDTIQVPAGSSARWVWRYPGPAINGFAPGDHLWLAPFDPRLGLTWALAVLPNGQLSLRAISYISDKVLPLDPHTFAPAPQAPIAFSILELSRKY